MNKIKSHYEDSLAYLKLGNFLKSYINDAIIICIGTDKCIGDCLGPLIGTFLTEKHFPLQVYGTLENPIHALNLETEIEKIKSIHPNNFIIAIDACLGDSKSIGEIHIREDSLKPGKGVGKTLPEIGNISIIGIIDSSSKKDIFSSRAIRLSLVMKIATVIVNSLMVSYSL
ncbi:MAG: spore protease YyaC [Sarcina sp.]